MNTKMIATVAAGLLLAACGSTNPTPSASPSRPGQPDALTWTPSLGTAAETAILHGFRHDDETGDYVSRDGEVVDFVAAPAVGVTIRKAAQA